MIHYFNSQDEIPDYPSSRVVYIDHTLHSEQEVIDWIEAAIEAPYEKDNWDGFAEAISDWGWLDCKTVVLVHHSLPDLDARDLGIYLDILQYEDRFLSVNSTHDRRLQIFYRLEDKDRIEFLLKKDGDISSGKGVLAVLKRWFTIKRTDRTSGNRNP